MASGRLSKGQDAPQQATTRQKTILNFFPTHVEPKAPSTRQCRAISGKYLYPTLHTKAGKFDREEFSSTKLGTVGGGVFIKVLEKARPQNSSSTPGGTNTNRGNHDIINLATVVLILVLQRAPGY